MTRYPCVPTGAGGVAGVTVRKLHGDAAGCCASWVLPSSQGVSKMGVSAKLGLWYNLHPFIFRVHNKVCKKNHYKLCHALMQRIRFQCQRVSLSLEECAPLPPLLSALQ